MADIKLLIVGGSSFIGKNLITKLPGNCQAIATYCKDASFSAFLKPFDNVASVQLDVNNPDSVSNLAAKLPFVDVILYLTANSDPRNSIPKPVLDLELNTLGMLRIIEKVKCGRFIYMSSSAVYLDTLLPYVFSKLASESYLKFFAEKKKLRYVIVRLYESFGPRSPKRKIFRKLVTQFDEKNPNVTLYGDGTNLLDHLYIDDTVDCLVKIINSDRGNVVVDLCTGDPISVKDLVMKIADIYSVSPKISYEGEAAEKTNFAGNPKPMSEIFGFEASISIEQGVKRWQEFKKQNNNEY